MPRKPITWENCIIYKIWKDDDFYIGSTTDFTNRKRSHKQSCSNEKLKKYNYKIYQTIREKGGWNTWQMSPLEEYKECKSQIEARIREEEWRVKIQANLNSRKCFGAETKQEYQKEYYQSNKEEIKEQQKQYQQDHKEEICERKKIYRNKHKEQLFEKMKEKFECPCKSICRISDKARHEKSLKHQNWLKSL